MRRLGEFRGRRTQHQESAAPSRSGRVGDFDADREFPITTFDRLQSLQARGMCTRLLFEDAHELHKGTLCIHPATGQLSTCGIRVVLECPLQVRQLGFRSSAKLRMVSQSDVTQFVRHDDDELIGVEGFHQIRMQVNRAATLVR